MLRAYKSKKIVAP